MQKPRENPARLDDARLPSDDVGADATIADPATQRRPHDEGSDANDTPDGLTPSEEAVRQSAEDLPTGRRPEGTIESIPVFDRRDLPPKV